MSPWMKSSAVAVATVALAACAGGPGRHGQGGPGGGYGGGYGGGGGPGMMQRAGPDHTPGWSMMTPAEREAHHRQMESVRTREECRQVMEAHQRRMAERARERGMPMAGRHDPCAGFER